MKGKGFAKLSSALAGAGFFVAAAIVLTGCGGGGTTNTVSVAVTGTAQILVPTQSETITATVTGATDQSVTFSCTFTTTENPTTATPSPKPVDKGNCTSDVGALSNQVINSTASSTATFTAPSKFPDQKTLPNVVVTITATSKANPKKTGTFKLAFDSGIRIFLSPATATLATLEQASFQAFDLNSNPVDPTTLTWGVTFERVATVGSVSCSGGSNDCGSIKTSGSLEVYTAPATVSKASTATSPAQNAAGIVTIFAFSNIDNARIAQATITLVQSGPITFQGISPNVVPQGAFQSDVFLSASNMTSQIGVVLTGPCAPGGGSLTLPASQVKVVFPAGTAAAATGARIRLFAAQLEKSGDCQISLDNGGSSTTITGGPFTFTTVPVRPSLLGLTTSNLSEVTFSSQGPIVVGGYFGPSASQITVKFDGQTLTTPVQQNTTPTARKVQVGLGSVNINDPSGHVAGLFPLAITNPLLASPASGFTNVTIIPDYSATNPPLSATGAPLASTATGIYTGPAPISLGTAVTPSSIAIDSGLRLAVVTDANPANANNIQILSLGSAPGTAPAVSANTSSQGSVATSVAVDDQAHIAAIVNYASRTLSLLNLQNNTLVTSPIDLSNNGQLIPGAATQPFPYAVGVDPFLHRAIVAFASTNVGLLVNFDPAATVTCLPNPNTAPPYCPIGFVSLNTGANPQVAFEPGAHRAYVAPGGGGSLASVDLSAAASAPVPINSLQRVANVVTVITASPHNLNASSPGTVLIGGSQAGDFSGSFPVASVTGASSFTYFQAGNSETVNCPGGTDTASCGATEGISPAQFFLSPSVQGIAVNPVTRQLVLADSNVTTGQIDFLNPLNQTLTSLSLFKDAVGTTNGGAPEIGDAAAGFQPFTNTAVIFNPNSDRNQISFLDPSARQRLAIINTNQTGMGTACVSGCGGASPVNINIPGAVAVDAVTNQAIVANSGSGSLSVVQLGKIKGVHIQEVRTPVIPSAPLLQRAILVPSDPNTGPQPFSVSGVDIFGTGFDAGSVVRLDGTPLPSNGFIDSTHLSVTIPVTVLANLPRRFALDVVSAAGVNSNVVDFSAIVSIGLPNCGSATPPSTVPLPGGVAIDDQRGIALVTETACNLLAKINLNTGGGFGVVSTIPTGQNPTAVAVVPNLTPTLGVALVTNHDANTVSFIDIDQGTQVTGVADLAVGTHPTGVATNPQTNFAIVANAGSNSANGIDLTPLTTSPIGKLALTTAATDQNPIAVAVDPDRGSNARGLAAVTALQLQRANSPLGAIDSIDIGTAVPVRSTTAASNSFLNATPTDITFDPIAPTGTTNPGLFYAVTSQSNQLVAFNPDNGTANPIAVGINPTSVASNPQSGTILTVNALGQTTSIVDSQTFQTRATIGVGASGQFAVAISQIKNFAVISDQSNNRILLFPLP